MFSMILVLVFLMAGGGKGSKRRRSPTPPIPAPRAEDLGSDYVPEDEESDEEDKDWEDLPLEELTRAKGKEKVVLGEKKGGNKSSTKAKGKKKVTEKEKGKKKVTEQEKGKKKVTEKEKGKKKLSATEKGNQKVSETPKTRSARKKPTGIKINEPTGFKLRGHPDLSSSESSVPFYTEEPIDSKRRSLFSTKQCIGERFVAAQQLFKHAPALESLIENGDLHDVCNFREKTGYGIELVREFYMRAGSLIESEGGPYSFTSRVRGYDFTVTPDDVASVLEMEAQTEGQDYLDSGFDSVRDWLTVMKALTLPNTESNGLVVMSKDLKLEYRFLNFIVCYNVLPLVNTKVVRWDRMLYMYLLGHPEIVLSRNINLNVPFLIWRRMAKDIKTSSLTERLPFPLLIMRLLCKFDVDWRCSSYEFPLGVISEITLAKSLGQLQSETRRSPTVGLQGSKKSTEPTSSRAVASSPALTPAQSRGAIFQAVTRLSAEVAELRRMVQAIFDKLGCALSDPTSPPPTPGAGST